MPVEGPVVEVTTCQICGSARTRLQFEDRPYRVLRCEECSLVFVTPRLEDSHLHEIYGEHYWQSESPKSQGYADYRGDEPLYLKTFRRRLRFVQRWTRPGSRVLDIGCAAGFFLRVMDENGHDVHGIELSPVIAAHARAHLGQDRIHVGPIESVPGDHPTLQRGSFDLVTLWDVVEHVADPQQLLRQAGAMCKPDGALILETQNVDSAFAGLLGKRWQHYKHQEHLYHFNPKTIGRLLSQAGLELLHNTPAYGGKYVSFAFIAERAGRLNRLASILLRPLRLLRKANVYLNFRDEMLVVARPTSRNGEGPG